MGKNKNNLLEGNILKGLILFAIPLFISSIFQQLYNTVDTMIVGNFLGDTSLAAIGACGAVYELLVGFALGIGNGVSIVVARNYGAKDYKLVKKSVAGSIVIGLAVTVVIMILSSLFLMPLLQVLNTPQDIIDEAYSYISTIVLCVGVMFSYNLCAGILRAIGNSIMPLVFLIISSVLNIILDIVFITRLGMGIRGAAVATVIAQGISVVLCLIYIWKKCSELIPKKRHFIIDKGLYKELVGQGLSMGLMVSIVSLGTVILQSGINGLGYLVIAGHTAARKLNSFCLTPILALAMSISTFVSQNKGANQIDRIKKGVKYANIMGICWAIFISILLLFAAPTMVKIISGSNENVIISNGAKYLIINAPFYTVLTMLFNFRYSLQGIGEKMIPLVSSIIELVGKVLFVIILIPKMGYLGVILCEPIIWCFMCAQLAYSFYKNSYISKENYNEVKSCIE